MRITKDQTDEVIHLLGLPKDQFVTHLPRITKLLEQYESLEYIVSEFFHRIQPLCGDIDLDPAIAEKLFTSLSRYYDNYIAQAKPYHDSALLLTRGLRLHARGVNENIVLDTFIKYLDLIIMAPDQRNPDEWLEYIICGAKEKAHSMMWSKGPWFHATLSCLVDIAIYFPYDRTLDLPDLEKEKDLAKLQVKLAHTHCHYQSTVARGLTAEENKLQGIIALIDKWEAVPEFHARLLWMFSCMITGINEIDYENSKEMLDKFHAVANRCALKALRESNDTEVLVAACSLFSPTDGNVDCNYDALRYYIISSARKLSTLPQVAFSFCARKLCTFLFRDQDNPERQVGLLNNDTTALIDLLRLAWAFCHSDSSSLFIRQTFMKCIVFIVSHKHRDSILQYIHDSSWLSIFLRHWSIYPDRHLISQIQVLLEIDIDNKLRTQFLLAMSPLVAV